MRDNLNFKEAADQVAGGRWFSSKAPPGVWRRELVHIAGLIISFIPQVERQLVPQTYFLLKSREETTVQCHISGRGGEGDLLKWLLYWWLCGAPWQTVDSDDAGSGDDVPCEGWPTAGSVWQQLVGGWDWMLGAPCWREAAASLSSPKKNNAMAFKQTLC